MYEVYAETMLWQDSDGNTHWPEAEANALAEVLEQQGYQAVEVIPL